MPRFWLCALPMDLPLAKLVALQKSAAAAFARTAEMTGFGRGSSRFSRVCPPGQKREKLEARHGADSYEKVTAKNEGRKRAERNVCSTRDHEHTPPWPPTGCREC